MVINMTEFLTANMGLTETGQFTLCGRNTVELAQKYGTPLYVMDEDLIRQNCRAFRQSIDRFYDGNGLVCYASKAFSCKEIYRIMAAEAMGIDVVSIGELYTALSVGFPAERAYFHGNNKTPEELTYAVRNRVGRIVVDNITELMLLEQIAEQENKKAAVLFRIKPGIDAHTHNFIRTGQIDSKFGFALETGEAIAAVKKVSSFSHLELKGMHCHIGSQIFDTEPFVEAAKVMMQFLAEIKQETGLELKELNLGGGFGIKYTAEDKPAPYVDYMEPVADAIKEAAQHYHIPVPYIYIEPGRSIVGAAGVTLYTVGGVKEIPNIRTYVSVDGGMTDNPRYALYQSRYEMLLANKAAQEKTTVVTVAGKCCESGDLLGEDIPLQPAESGDILAVLSTGAYNYSMSSNYNRIAKPAVIMVSQAEEKLIVKRETLEDLVRNDI